MPDTLPFFPLNLVVYPGESLNLHVFEPRYRQLVADCHAGSGTFGIPAYVDGKVKEYGTEVKLVDITNRYEDGRLDIKTEGQHIFELASFDNPLGEKLYAGGQIVRKPLPEDDSSPADRILLLEKANQLYDLMGVQVSLTAETEYLSFQIAHKIGMSIAQEYQLLRHPEESRRQAILLDHLTRSIPVVREMERTKERIRMNGHFKDFKPLDF